MSYGSREASYLCCVVRDWERSKKLPLCPDFYDEFFIQISCIVHNCIDITIND